MDSALRGRGGPGGRWARASAVPNSSGSQGRLSGGLRGEDPAATPGGRWRCGGEGDPAQLWGALGRGWSTQTLASIHAVSSDLWCWRWCWGLTQAQPALRPGPTQPWPRPGSIPGRRPSCRDHRDRPQVLVGRPAEHSCPDLSCPQRFVPPLNQESPPVSPGGSSAGVLLL